MSLPKSSVNLGLVASSPEWKCLKLGVGVPIYVFNVRAKVAGGLRRDFQWGVTHYGIIFQKN